MHLPFGNALETRGSVRALGSINVGSDLLLNGRIDGIVDQDDVDGGLIGAAFGQVCCG